MIVLVPRVWMDPSTFEFSPLITAPITMIVVTPIMMPRTVRNDRSVLRRNTSKRQPDRFFQFAEFACLPHCLCLSRLLGPQRHHRIEPRRFRGGIDAEK